MADTNEAIKSALSLIDEIKTAVASLPGRDAEFSTEGVNRVADKIERDGNPILAQCFRDLAIQRDRLAEKLTATPPADAALADRITPPLIIHYGQLQHENDKLREEIAALRARAVPDEALDLLRKVATSDVMSDRSGVMFVHLAIDRDVIDDINAMLAASKEGK